MVREFIFLVSGRELIRLTNLGEFLSKQPKSRLPALQQAILEDRLTVYRIWDEAWVPSDQLRKVWLEICKEEKQKVGEHNASQIIQAISPEKVAASTKEDRPEEVVYA
ncbi:hypothetical protein A7Q09_02740 [Methylacidiphilum sp. Yel]|uniref:hypothetical protein n=1 Tax=Methylacidiphilum sp. Yel TaxID=1847730 RepID=UPI0010691E87|nr:hypothetical protein [Methylacidiphilum sp. Yel]TFE65506.1 hypothetical protein A7Q09_02740 [Methylacidiphilum sp. Yel]